MDICTAHCWWKFRRTHLLIYILNSPQCAIKVVRMLKKAAGDVILRNVFWYFELEVFVHSCHVFHHIWRMHFLCDNLWLPSKLDVTVVAHRGRRAKHFWMIVCLCLGAASRHFGQPTLDARLFSVDQIRRGIHGIGYIGQLKRSIKTCSLFTGFVTERGGGMIFLLFYL